MKLNVSVLLQSTLKKKVAGSKIKQTIQYLFALALMHKKKKKRFPNMSVMPPQYLLFISYA